MAAADGSATTAAEGSNANRGRAAKRRLSHEEAAASESGPTFLPKVEAKPVVVDLLQNQLCRVCDEPAAGFHFGAFTCEGCKSFFGRTCNNQSVIQECKNNYSCVVDKKNRTACKACRLRKCLRMGMSKSGSRYGRRSNWFKIHCLMQQSIQNLRSQPVTPVPLVPSLPMSPSSLLQQKSVLEAWSRMIGATNGNSVVSAADNNQLPMDLSKKSEKGEEGKESALDLSCPIK